MAAPHLIGTFIYESSENIDEYLKDLGVGLVLRKVQTVARPTYTITYSEEANKWTFVSESAFKVKEISFKPSEKIEDETFDCRKCQTSVEILDDGQVMKLTQICEEGPNVETIITASETGITMSLKSGEFTCKIKGRRVQFQLENQPAAAVQVLEQAI